MSIKITESDKKLLYILFIILIVAASYYFGYTNINKMSEDLENEKRELQLTYNELYPNYARKDLIAGETTKYEALYNELVTYFSNGTTQDNSIIFLNAIENENDVWFNQVSMTETVPAYTFGQVISTNPYRDGQTVYSSDMKGHKTTFTISYEASYDNWKQMVKSINTYTYKCTLESITATYDQSGDVVSGNMTMSIYDITGSTREFPSTTIKGVPSGTGNIYSSSTFFPNMTLDDGEGNSIISDHDLYIILNSTTSDLDSVVIGQANDPFSEKAVSSLENDVVDGYLVITGEGGNYNVGYKVGNTTYPVDDYIEGEKLETGDSLDMVIISSNRKSEEDKSGLSLIIENKSDIVLNIKIINDDNDDPRFKLEKSTGQVNIY